MLEDVSSFTIPDATWLLLVSFNSYRAPAVQEAAVVSFKLTSLLVSHNSAELLKEGKSSSV